MFRFLELRLCTHTTIHVLNQAFKTVNICLESKDVDQLEGQQVLALETKLAFYLLCVLL